LASSIVGGAENYIEGRFSFIGGGYDNDCYDNFSAIVAGWDNNMPSAGEKNEGANIIAAGQSNKIDGGSNQAIIAGSINTIEYSPPNTTIPGSSISAPVIIDPDLHLESRFNWGDGENPATYVGATAYTSSWLGSFIKYESNYNNLFLIGDNAKLEMGWQFVAGIFGSAFYGFIYPVFERYPFQGKTRAFWFYTNNYGWLFTTIAWHQPTIHVVYSYNLSSFLGFEYTAAIRYYRYDISSWISPSSANLS
jgi:hypothetical protein